MSFAGAQLLDPGLSEDGESNVLTLEPVGPVADRFINDTKFISAIMGPYGSAKTTSCFQKIINAALWQKPMADGVRRIAVCCIRATYSQLATNVMQDWFRWFPQTKANWNGELNRHIVRRSVIGLGEIEITMWFRAMGDLKAEQVFKGMSLTILWLNEVDTLDPTVIRFGLPRVGRYHGSVHGWAGVIADFNAPDVDNWTYDLLVEGNLGIPDDMLEGFREQFGDEFGISFHRQPGGLSPEAENLKNLRKGYYQGMMLTMAENDIRRFVHNEFGAVRAGQPVFPEFNDRMHMAQAPLRALADLPIVMGIDGGRTPSLVFAQVDQGQLRVLDELVIYDPGKNNELERMGPTAFAELAREFVTVAYPKAQLGLGFYDPATDWGEYDDDGTWIEIFRRAFGGKWKPGGPDGNRLEPRLEAVRGRLNRSPGGKPAMLVSPTCKMLRRGFNNGYVIERVATSAGGRFRDKPTKNDFSHVQDALQYLCLGLEQKGRGIAENDARQAARIPAKPGVSYSKNVTSLRAGRSR